MAESQFNRLIVCVLAHNEETVIADTVLSLGSLQIEPGGTLDTFVFTNGCSDRTNDIVAALAAIDSRVHLVALPEKGKVYAARASIAYFRTMHQQRPDFDRVFYVDADVTFPDSLTLIKMSRSLDRSVDLYLVSSFSLAETGQSNDNWFLSRFTAVREAVARNLQANIVRGRCYVIRFNALMQVDYPLDVLSDDLYLELRLNGHYIMDYSILTATKLKSTFKGEIRRDLFTLMANDKLRHPVGGTKVVAVDSKTARKEWSLSFPRPRQLLRYVLSNAGFTTFVIMALWFPIHQFNQFRAKRIIRESRKRKMNLLDYWSTQR